MAKQLYFAIFLLISLLLLSCKSEQVKPNPSNTETAQVAKDSTQQKKATMEYDISYCMGKYKPETHEDFVVIPIKYADREGMYMRKDAYDAFVAMYEAAAEDNIHLQIRSATRNFDYQKGIWERKWTGATVLSDGTNVKTDISDPVEKALKILEYSSMPGTSRHHWGTDIDLNAFNNQFFEKGVGLRIYNWLDKNASKYDFCQPYTPKGKDRPNGYNEEKWHWSYMPVSRVLTATAREKMRNEMITGFYGAETAPEIDVVNKYVLGISCQH